MFIIGKKYEQIKKSFTLSAENDIISRRKAEFSGRADTCRQSKRYANLKLT